LQLGPDGASKTVTVTVVEAPYGYLARVRDRAGHVVAESTPPARPSGNQARPTVALLSQADSADGTVRGLDNYFGDQSGTLTTFTSARDFPDSALDLAGLQAIVIAAFDTGSLSPRQLQAIQGFVALGGGLVIGGGVGAARVVGPLPEGLVPMRPSSSSTASLAALTDLYGATTTAATIVARGDLRQGRAVFSTADGVPLVVQMDYGAGRVVQLAYDPFDAPFMSDRMLRQAAWDQGLMRSLARFGRETERPVAPTNQLWSAVLERPARAQWPPSILWLLIPGGLAMAVVGYVFVPARRRGLFAWLAVPVMALILGGVLYSHSETRAEMTERAVGVTTLGPGGAALTDAYVGVWANRAGDRSVNLGSDRAASTVFAQPSLVAAERDPDLRRSGRAGGTVEYLGGRTTVQYAAKDGSEQNLHSLSLDHRPGLESHLSLSGSGPPESGGLRVVGTIVNQSAVAIQHVRAQLPEGGQARVTEIIRPGQTLEVDSPFVWGGGFKAGKGLPAPRLEQVLFAAANRAFTRSGQLVVVGQQESKREGSSIVVQVVPIEHAENLVAYLGNGNVVTRLHDPSGTDTTITDIGGVAGIGPVKVLYGTYAEPPEVFDFSARTWRRLPPGDKNAGLVDAAPLGASEVNDGLVRVRIEEPFAARSFDMELQRP
jgi:hypothetical protein